MFFVDRVQEMSVLQTAYEKPESSLFVLYGRRRVGKTTLLSEFCKEKPSLYYLATEESIQANRNAFRLMAADFLQNDLLKSATDASWEMIFSVLLSAQENKKLVIVLDEFQYLGKADKAFPSVFQKIWDTILKNKNVEVILCGSLVHMMMEQTLSYSSPLYGRRTGQIRLKQIPFAYYHEFFPGKSRKELIEMYAVTGGVPKYIELFSQSKDIYSAIETCVLNRSGYLYDEPHFLLQQEVSEVGSYFSIIKAIAAGNTKLSAIAGVLEVKSTSLTKYLKTLIDLDILEREVPVTEDSPEKSKRGLYKIKDNYLRFWFAFVYPNMSFIESGHGRIVMDKIRKGLVRNHIAFVYEDVCAERMWEMNAQGVWPFYFSKLGRYWDSKEEIDIVAIDPDGKNLILGECKYWQEPVGISVLRSLEAKAEMVAWEKGKRKTWLVLFSVNGFTKELRAVAETRTDLQLCEE